MGYERAKTLYKEVYKRFNVIHGIYAPKNELRNRYLNSQKPSKGLNLEIK